MQTKTEMAHVRAGKQVSASEAGAFDLGFARVRQIAESAADRGMNIRQLIVLLADEQKHLENSPLVRAAASRNGR